jgi:hypothetical protein
MFNKQNLLFLGSNGFHPNGNNHPDNTLSTQKSTSSEPSDIYSLIETMRSKWMSSNESNRSNYLDRLKDLSDKHLQLLNSQYSLKSDSQLHQVLHTFFSSVLDLLSYITSSNLELSIKIKLFLSTRLAWIIKHGQGNYCKKNYKIICIVFKNILLNGQSNNRQLAVGYSLFFLSQTILLFSNRNSV